MIKYKENMKKVVVEYNENDGFWQSGIIELLDLDVQNPKFKAIFTILEDLGLFPEDIGDRRIEPEEPVAGKRFKLNIINLTMEDARGNVLFTFEPDTRSGFMFSTEDALNKQ